MDTSSACGTARRHKLQGNEVVTGVFDCEYSDGDEKMLSNAELRDMITYEVELQLGTQESAAFFGFKGKDNIRFNVPAESL